MTIRSTDETFIEDINKMKYVAAGVTPDWRDRLKVGDIIYENGNPKKPRMVRSVTYWRKTRDNVPILAGISMTILRSSWTGRCGTCIGRSCLKARGFTPAHVTIKSCNTFCQEISKNINDYHYHTLGPDDVRGIR